MQANQDQNTQKRLKQQQSFSKMYPQMVRVQIKRSSNSKLPQIQQTGIMVKKKVTIGIVMEMIKKKLHIKQSDAIFIFAERTILHFNDIVGDIYSKFKNTLSTSTLVLEYTQFSVFGHK